MSTLASNAIDVTPELAQQRLGQLLTLLLDSASKGRGVMPPLLGLDAHEFAGLEKQFGFELPDSEKSTVNDGPERSRFDERDELIALFLEHAPADASHSTALATVIATGCLGQEHLWEDMGFDKRDSLSEFIRLAFPDLFARNTQNMKWKRFFYKQLCEREGLYVCRAPSCGQCPEYQACFITDDSEG